MARFDILHEIERLNPERDNQRIMHLSFGYEFPWDSVRALEVALYRTYCIPSISTLLDRTGEFYKHAQRRYDDTAILMAEMCEWGYEEGRGKVALDRMNWAHSHFAIANNDFLYVLSTFIFEPIKWIDAFGWRKLSLNERLGYYYFWREIGKRMGIKDIPADLRSVRGLDRCVRKSEFPLRRYQPAHRRRHARSLCVVDAERDGALRAVRYLRAFGRRHVDGFRVSEAAPADSPDDSRRPPHARPPDSLVSAEEGATLLHRQSQPHPPARLRYREARAAEARRERTGPNVSRMKAWPTMPMIPTRP